MKILLTGASGFIGGHLAPRLVETGHEVICGVRRSSAYVPPSGARRIELDLARGMEGVALPRVDAVVHLAQANVRFPEDAQELFAVNTGSTLELLDHAHRCGAEHFVYASSASVYGFGDRPFLEDDQLTGRDFYAATKTAAEGFVRAYGDLLTTAVLRLVAPYGPGQQARMIPRLIERVLAGAPITLNGGGRPRMNPLYVDDVVRTVVGVLELDKSTVLNVAGDEQVTVKELVESIGSVLGKQPVFEESDEEVPGDIVTDTSRLHELLDLRPLVPLVEGLRSTIKPRS